MTEFKFPVKITWYDDKSSWWNETCIKVVEVFGLPGGRYMYHPQSEYMSFNFKSEKDQKLCEILLSERL